MWKRGAKGADQRRGGEKDAKNKKQIKNEKNN